MLERFSKLPQSLMEKSRVVRLGALGIPTLLAHPDWENPVPTVLWMHGRTAHKELDPGRYLRWLRAGIGTCAVDLPGHGERFERRLNHPGGTLEVIEQMAIEIDGLVEGLAGTVYQGVFDLDRLGIGGMSAGGMAALLRLCDDHPFACAAVEGATGCIKDLYADGGAWDMRFDQAKLSQLDVCARLHDRLGNRSEFRPIPLLAVHAQEDEVVPIGLQERFLATLRTHYTRAGADPALIELISFPRTGAPNEHEGFGKYSNDAKNAQTDFWSRWLRPAGA